MIASGNFFSLRRRCLMIWLIVFSAAGAIAHAQSSDPNSPMPLPGNPFNGSIRAKDNASYYYTFMAGPGNITVSVPVKTNGNLSQLNIEIYDSSSSLLLSIDATSSGSTQKQTFVLNTQQTLLMKLSGLRSNDGGSFSLRLEGRVSLGGAVTPSSPGVSRSNDNPNLPPRPKDAQPPRIRITSPSVTRGQSASVGASRVTVQGEASDESGVSEVIVRGVSAKLDASGNFSAEVMLRVGENQIAVSATDTYGNRSEESFLINRTGDLPSGPAQPTEDLLKGRYYALLIAVEDYKGPVFGRLANPVKDAEKLRDVLTTYYTFNKQDVTLLQDPTRDEIIDAIERLENIVKPEDNLLIFYAGHGQWDKDRKQGYWIPSDVQGDSRRKWLSNGEVRDAIRGIKARHTLLITDACFSGGILGSRGAVVPPSIEELMRMQSRTAMTSGAMTTVPDRSVFLEYLTKYLAENKEAYKTANSIFTSLQTVVIDNSPRMDDGTRTTPLYGSIQEAGHEGGDFIFVRRQ